MESKSAQRIYIADPGSVKPTAKGKRFNKVLLAAKKALDSIDMPFHLHSGTALGAQRERTFIEHDHDIDLAVFYKDASTPEKVQEIVDAMLENGFTLRTRLGSLERGQEFQFDKNDVGLDIVWVYEGNYRGKDIYFVANYFGKCDTFPHKTCVLAYTPYVPHSIELHGVSYKVLPQKTLVDAYGPDWRIPKKFNYTEGLDGGYTNLIRDYYAPRPADTKIAFMFMVKDNVVDNSVWVNFFKQDDYPIKNYNVYAHVYKPNGTHPEWIEKARIPTIPTKWCTETLLRVHANLLKKALKDPSNKYFVLLSQDCIPLYTFAETYHRITATSKSQINYTKDSRPSSLTGLWYSDQWTILNRKCAKLMVSLMYTQRGDAFREQLRKITYYDGMGGPPQSNRGGHACADEMFPMQWLIKRLGPVSSPEFKAQVIKQQVTYTHWTGGKSPVKIDNYRLYQLTKEAICSGDVGDRPIFGRKFTAFAARHFAMSCAQF